MSIYFRMVIVIYIYMVSAVKMVAKQSSTGVAPNWDVHPCKCGITGITPIYGYRNGNNDDQLVDLEGATVPVFGHISHPRYPDGFKYLSDPGT